jgi:hypothetical protein
MLEPQRLQVQEPVRPGVLSSFIWPPFHVQRPVPGFVRRGAGTFFLDGGLDFSEK